MLRRYRFKILLFLVFAFSWFTKASLQIDEDQIKASMLVYICDFITWQNEQELNEFSVGILGYEPAFTNALKEISKSVEIKSLPVKLIKVDADNIPRSLKVLYIGDSYLSEVDSLLRFCIQNNILLVGDQLPENTQTHINFIINPQNQSVNFIVDRENLNRAGFRYRDQLLIYGGDVSEIRELYQLSQQMLQEEEQKVQALHKEVQLKDRELAHRKNQIDSLSDSIEVAKTTLDTLSYTISYQNKLIQSQGTKLQNQHEQFVKNEMELFAMKERQQVQQNEIELREKELQKLDTIIQKREAEIREQNKILDSKEAVIKAKNRVMYLLIMLGALLSLIGVLIYRAYQNKRNYNLVLEKRVSERTHELDITNTNLKQEVERRKVSENEVIKSERNYREIFNSSTDAIFIHDKQGRILDVNDSMIKLFGYKKFEVNDLTLGDISSGSGEYNHHTANEQLNNAINDGKQVFDWQAKRKNGEVFWVEVALKATNIGGQDRILAVVRDIDEKKRNALELERYRKHLENMVDQRTTELRSVNNELNATNEELQSTNENLLLQKKELEETLDQLKRTQEQLIDAEKMASVGMLASGVAHEINNPLNFIQAGITALVSYFEDELSSHINQVKPMLNGIQIGVKRAADIVTSLNHFSRKSESYTEECLIPTILDNCLVMLQNRLKDKVIIKKDYLASNSVCKGNEGKLHQVFINILSNAIDAIPETGEIRITTQNKANSLEVIIEDSGTGIAPQHLKKITDPFFTTKNPGQGTGLGLAIVNKIISNHKGRLKIESKPGKGTRVAVILPV